MKRFLFHSFALVVGVLVSGSALALTPVVYSATATATPVKIDGTARTDCVTLRFQTETTGRTWIGVSATPETDGYLLTATNSTLEISGDDQFRNGRGDHQDVLDASLWYHETPASSASGRTNVICLYR